jgi:hypothetical protein
MNTRAKVLVWSIVIALLCLIPNVGAYLFTVVVMGIIPGTGLTIPPLFMLLAYPLLLVGVSYWIIKQPMTISDPTHKISSGQSKKHPSIDGQKKSRSQTKKSASRSKKPVTA